VLISGQAARLTTLSGDAKRQEHREQLSKQIHDNLAGLEEDLSKLRVERDITLAEMEELSASKRLERSYPYHPLVCADRYCPSALATLTST